MGWRSASSCAWGAWPAEDPVGLSGLWRVATTGGRAVGPGVLRVLARLRLLRHPVTMRRPSVSRLPELAEGTERGRLSSSLRTPCVVSPPGIVRSREPSRSTPRVALCKDRASRHSRPAPRSRSGWVRRPGVGVGTRAVRCSGHRGRAVARGHAAAWRRPYGRADADARLSADNPVPNMAIVRAPFSSACLRPRRSWPRVRAAPDRPRRRYASLRPRSTGEVLVMGGS